eukprot:CAMPEP_0176433954 /NCGR_PEP_ID=MMETSP0127-20121128/16369_1 /TAXON_ID=938130 /ORGANISM="Platyophrya macrostoma, Strain WH" /LENGTH=665 /DNA_ID=CAMNT_0017816559 /DNA_START=41 /DNA_END=2038 /DNA_ORIENTATION=-
MSGEREIKICLREGSEPYSFKFSDDVDIEDIREVLQQAIENFAVQNNVNYEAYNAKTLESLDLRHLTTRGVDTIVLNEKGKSPEKFRQSVHGAHDGADESFGGQGRTNAHKQAHVRAGVVEDRDKSPGKAGIATQLSKRNAKPNSESIVHSRLLAASGLMGMKLNLNVGEQTEQRQGSSDQMTNFVKIELDALYERSIRNKELISTGPQKINLEGNQNGSGGYYDPSNTKHQIHHTVSIVTQKNSNWETGTIGTTCRDGNDRNIYSTEVGHPPFTFSLAGYKYSENMPPPRYLPYEEIRVLKPLDRESIFKGQDITKEGELKITDKESLKNQEGIVSDVLKRLAKSLAEGRGVVGVSLPIRIFEPRSLVERITDWWAFAPVYLTPAALKYDPLDRFKAVISFAMSGLYVSVSPFKPFNPILGETYQGEFPGHGVSVNVEHTSHHPPIANFYLAHKDWKFYGRYEFKGEISVMKNCLYVDQEGPNTVEFSDGHKIVFYQPKIRIGGMISGDKVTRYQGIVKFVDQKNKLKCVLKFDPSDRRPIYDKKRKDVYSGLIYRYKEGVAKKDGDDEKMKDLEEKVEEVHGQWLKHLYFGEQKWWDIDEQQPVRAIPVENPLMSDWRFREDLVWVKRGDRKIGETWKLFLEVRQREEKKLREAGKKKRAKNN